MSCLSPAPTLVFADSGQKVAPNLSANRFPSVGVISTALPFATKNTLPSVLFAMCSRHNPPTVSRVALSAVQKLHCRALSAAVYWGSFLWDPPSSRLLKHDTKVPSLLRWEERDEPAILSILRRITVDREHAASQLFADASFARAGRTKNENSKCWEVREARKPFKRRLSSDIFAVMSGWEGMELWDETLMQRHT